MAGKRRDVHALRSLRDIQDLLDMYGAKRGCMVQVVALSGIRDATSARNLLRHQAEEMGWKVQGMAHLNALVVVDGLIGDSAALLDEAIRHMEVAAAAAAAPDPVLAAQGRAAALLGGDLAEPLVPALTNGRLSTYDEATVNLAERMLEVGMGLRGQALVPGPGILDLAARVINDLSPTARHSGIDDPATINVALDDSSGIDDPGTIDLALDDSRSGPDDPATIDLALDDIENVDVATATCLGSDDPTMKLADLMLEAGTGLRSQALVPGPGILDLAARVLHGENPRHVAEHMVLSPTARRSDTEDPANIDFTLDDSSSGTDDPAVILLALNDSRSSTDDSASTDLALDDIATVDVTPATCLGSDDRTPTMKLADLMLEAATGHRAEALLPAPAIVELAARVVADESPPRNLTPATSLLFTRLLDSGTALRHHQLGSASIQRAVQSLGAQMEDLAGAVLTARHPPPMLLRFLRTVKAALVRVWELNVPPNEFQFM